MAKKKQVGGAREGAGRKPGPDGPTMLVAVTVPRKLVKELDRLRKTQKLTRSAAVTEAIRGLLANAANM